MDGSLLPFVAGFAAEFVARASLGLFEKIRYRKLLPILSQVFTAADPIIKQNFSRLSEHDLYELVRDIIYALGDNQLSPHEVEVLCKLFFSKFKLAIAAQAEVPTEEVGFDDIHQLAKKAVELIKK